MSKNNGKNMQNEYLLRALSGSLQDNSTRQVILKKLTSLLDDEQKISSVELIEANMQYQLQLKLVSECDFDELKNKLRKIAQQLEMDLILKSWSDRKILPGLLIMDMDSTLVQAETIDEIARVAGVGEKVAKITESAMRGELDFTQSLYARVSMLEGVSLDAIELVHDCLPLTGGAKLLLKKATENGCHTALVSGGFTYYAGPIAESLGIDTLSANTLEIIDNKLTGKVLGDVVDGNSKLETLNQLKEQLGLSSEQIVAIGDGANDLPMLTAAGTGIAFHAKPTVQEQASTALNFNDLNAVCWLLNW
ncbi:MAG: phosphoserine phosphatase SerB [Gammaproteobacteria bacterium]|nr:phosphoserine phosphatase SerB [Gammaproteobacteria bacterium]